MGLRARGREKIQGLITRAQTEFAAATTPERFTEIHRDIAVFVSRIEKEQTVGFFAVVPEMSLPASQPSQPRDNPLQIEAGRCDSMLPPHVYQIHPRADKRGVDLISDALPFNRLWYGEPNAISNAIGYAELFWPFT
jgi:hypothetical protein